MHGDTSLDVDRINLLQVRLVERFGQKLAGKRIRLHKFYVLEANLRNSFVRDASGKSEPNDGPFEPTLIAELNVSVDGLHHFYTGRGEVKLPQNSRATHAALAKVTNEAIDSMLEDMAREWSRIGKDDG